MEKNTHPACYTSPIRNNILKGESDGQFHFLSASLRSVLTIKRYLLQITKRSGLLSNDFIITQSYGRKASRLDKCFEIRPPRNKQRREKKVIFNFVPDCFTRQRWRTVIQNRDDTYVEFVKYL